MTSSAGCRTTARRCTGINVAQQLCMALFWETNKTAPPSPKPAPLSPLAIALLLKLQESTK